MMETILYVEDDLSLIDGLEYTLETNGYSVDIPSRNTRIRACPPLPQKHRCSRRRRPWPWLKKIGRAHV